MKPCESFLFSKNGSLMLMQLVLIPFLIYIYIYIYIYNTHASIEKQSNNLKKTGMPSIYLEIKSQSIKVPLTIWVRIMTFN